MNKKDDAKKRVLSIVVEECTSEDAPITCDDVRGKNKTDVVHMTRCMFVSHVRYLGYSKTSIAGFLHRTEQSVTDMIAAHDQFRDDSWAYRVADANVTIRIKELMSNI